MLFVESIFWYGRRSRAGSGVKVRDVDATAAAAAEAAATAAAAVATVAAAAVGAAAVAVAARQQRWVQAGARGCGRATNVRHHRSELFENQRVGSLGALTLALPRALAHTIT